MKRAPAVMMMALLVAVLITIPLAAQKSRAVSGAPQIASGLTRLQATYGAEELSKGVYIGTEFCLACHKSMATYKDTNHASFLRRPLKEFSL
ncbi:MAG TPA: hypothetical protein VMU84_04485, partial [Thermoanaerobaculia bacterium]|nr:hypothetical protein [Thermoanaerobaculia bacterium]